MSIIPHPKDTEQLKLEEGEEIVRIVRKHWFILFTKTASIVLSWILPFVFLWLFLSSSDVRVQLPQIADFYRPLTFFGGAWTLLVWIALFSMWTDYYLDMWIITTKRVIAIDQRGFFNRSVASFRLERLQDITVDIKGIIATLLDFGSVSADTASHSDVFVIRGAPNPREIKSLIQSFADKVANSPHIRI